MCSPPYGLPFQFLYITVELQANHMGIMEGAIGNVLSNNLGTWGTLWVPDGNLMRTHWEQGKIRSSSPHVGFRHVVDICGII
jgi:hypothetical protein